ncbi:MAG: ABC transporter permease [Thermaceae bacterium]|nr:ABC transporter permease [Thermaceae bacterium]
MLLLAWRNLSQNRTRLLVSAGGVGLALTLVLALDAIVNGVEHQLAAYIERSRAEVWVAQSGVRNLHMVASTLPASAVEQVAAVEGVASVTPLLYTSQNVQMGRDNRFSYVFGLPPDAAAGGPWRVAAGKALPGPGEAIVDARQARDSGVGLGDSVRIFGRRFLVAGLSEGSSSLTNSVTFVSQSDFARLRRIRDSLSYLLVRVEPGQSPEVVARRIEARVKVSALSTPEFARQERKVVGDMGADAINLMNLMAFLIGLAVLALTVYTATLSRRTEFGVLKAVGAGTAQLVGTVLAQALYSVAAGLLLAGVVSFLVLPLLLPWLGFNLPLQPTLASVLKVGLVALGIGGLAAVIPVIQIAGLDPAMVFRGGGR